MKEPFKFDETRMLLLEGKNDCFVIAELCKYHKVEQNFVLYNCGSDNKLMKKADALLRKSEIPEVLGIVLDADENAIGYIKSVVEDAKDKKHTSFKDRHKSKAMLHTYLSWQDEPGLPMGSAINARILQPDTEIAIEFVDWLKKLFRT